MRKLISLFFMLFMMISFCFLFFSNKTVKTMMTWHITEKLAKNTKDTWFHCASIDPIFYSNEIQTFAFYKWGMLEDRENTLFILNEDVYKGDSIASELKHKIYLPVKTFASIMENMGSEYFCKIDSVNINNGKVYYRVKKNRVAFH